MARSDGFTGYYWDLERWWIRKPFVDCKTYWMKNLMSLLWRGGLKAKGSKEFQCSKERNTGYLRTQRSPLLSPCPLPPVLAPGILSFFWGLADENHVEFVVSMFKCLFVFWRNKFYLSKENNWRNKPRSKVWKVWRHQLVLTMQFVNQSIVHQLKTYGFNFSDVIQAWKKYVFVCTECKDTE